MPAIFDCEFRLSKPSGPDGLAQPFPSEQALPVHRVKLLSFGKPVDPASCDLQPADHARGASVLLDSHADRFLSQQHVVVSIPSNTMAIIQVGSHPRHALEEALRDFG